MVTKRGALTDKTNASPKTQDTSSSQIIQNPILVYGIPRSGTTVVVQVLRELFPVEKVAKSHTFKPDYPKVVIPYRDFRDVIASQWRVGKNMPFKADRILWVIHHATLEDKTMNILNVLYFIYKVKKNIRIMERYNTVPHTDVLLLKYEDFFQDFNYIFDAFEKFLQIQIPPKQRTVIAEKCSLNRNKEIAQRLQDFEKIDKTTGIHGDHIHTGKQGSWHDFIAEKNRWLIPVFLKSELKKYGYSE